MTDRSHRRSYTDPATHEILLQSTEEGGWTPAIDTRRRTYTDPATHEILLLEWTAEEGGWTPAIDTLRAWQTGLVDLCRHPSTDTVMTVPDGLCWPLLTTEEECDVMYAIPKPWIAPHHIQIMTPMSAPVAPVQRPAAAAVAAVHFPRHLVHPVLAHAEATHAICAISLEPITTTNATVTPCGHIFQTAAIREWLSQSSLCPECRAPIPL